MIHLDFDLEKVFDKTTLDNEAKDIQRRIRIFLDAHTGNDEVKGMQKLRSMCFRMDYYNTGFLTVEQFSSVLEQLNVIKHKKITQHLFDLYDKDDDGHLEYKEFCGSVYGNYVAPKANALVRDVLEVVRTKILERGMNNMRGLSGSFRIMDSDKSGKLSQNEFREGLLRYGCELSKEDFVLVFTTFARGDGKISVTEFLAALRGKLSDRRRKLVELAFQQLDKDQTGVCEFKEICRIYDATKHPMVVAKQATVEEILMQFISSWDRDGDGTITLAEFMDYYKDLSCSIDNDDYFELMIRNAWHLAGGKGWCANTSNLRVLVVHSDDSQEVVGINNDLGLDKDDLDAVRAALEGQGVTDIKMIKFAM